eukprot:m.58343 g.58343  ORF g.58343 m.58343 type:complete len:1093 (+) comp34803_c0_seq2:99-3377(+)
MDHRESPGRLRATWLLVVLGILLQFQEGDAVAVMSIDFGSEWLKIAIVKPGVPMEIALNKESQRKTANMVSLKGNERLFAAAAQTTGVRHPKSAYQYLQHLIGKKYDSPQVELYKKRFPYYDITKDVVRDTVLFQHNENTTYSVEELLAMIFKNAKLIAEAYADQPIQDVVITVPPFFNQAERRSVLSAAQLGQLKVLQLMNDNTAFALNYGVFRRADFNATPTNILFYDMGSTSTVATLATYQTVKIKEGGLSETVPQLTVKGVGYDQFLGGLDFNLRMRDLLVKRFQEQGKGKSDVTESPRAMAKLLKEANRVKTVLSANTEHISQIEGLIDDVDFRAQVTREEFENACADLFERVQKPVEEALKSSQITLNEVDQVIVVGGGSRVPKVQELLLKAVERSDLGKSVNADEAAALGAVYVGAFLSKAFRVKKFAIKDASIFPIQVSFEREKIDDEGVASVRRVTRTLFNRNNPFPQKKVMTFNKQMKDFTFTLDYGGLDFLPEEQMNYLGALNLSKVSLSGIESVMLKHNSEGIEAKGIKAHFQLDGSGLLSIEKVEAVFEKAPDASEPAEEESAFARLGNTISSFFGSSSTEKDEEKDKDAKASSEPVERRSEEEVNGDENGENGKEAEPAEGKDSSEKEKEPLSEEEKTDDSPVEKEETETADKEESAEEGSKDEKEESKEEESEKASKSDETEEDESKTEKEADPPQAEEKPAESNFTESEGKPVNVTEGVKNATNATGEGKGKNETVSKPPSQPKPSIIRESIDVSWEIIDLEDLLTDMFTESEKKLRDLDKRDEEKLDREKAVNTLESFIYETQEKAEGDLVHEVSTEEEREVINKALAEASEWLYEDGYDASTKDYEDKLAALRKLCRPVFYRAHERATLPVALADMKNSLNLSSYFLGKSLNLTEYEQIFTDTELKTLGKVINETKDWLYEKELEHNKTSPKDDSVLTVFSVHEKGVKLDREVMYLINKAKWARPLKTRNETVSAKNATKNATSTDEKQSAEDKKGDDELPTTPAREEEKPGDAPGVDEKESVEQDKAAKDFLEEKETVSSDGVGDESEENSKDAKADSEEGVETNSETRGGEL